MNRRAAVDQRRSLISMEWNNRKQEEPSFVDIGFVGSFIRTNERGDPRPVRFHRKFRMAVAGACVEIGTPNLPGIVIPLDEPAEDADAHLPHVLVHD